MVGITVVGKASARVGVDVPLLDARVGIVVFLGQNIGHFLVRLFAEEIPRATRGLRQAGPCEHN